MLVEKGSVRKLEKKAVSRIMQTLFLISMLTLAFNAQPVKAEGGVSPWITQTVDDVGNVGYPTSLAFDILGNPSIAYYDYTNFQLKYAHWNGANWDIEVVDYAGNFAGWGPYYCYSISLVFDFLGNPAIAYYNAYPYWDLKYACFNGVEWDIQTVYDDGLDGGWGRCASLAFDPAGDPAIAFRYMPSRLAYAEWGLGYAHWNGISWEVERVDIGYGTGAYVSLRFNPLGNPAIAYQWQGVYQGPSNLRYAYFSGTVWNIKIVDGNPSVYPSLAFDPSGNPAISYYDDVNKDLKYARFNEASWSIQVIDSVGIVGTYPSLAFDPRGNPAISYYDSTNNDLKYAYFDGSKWNIEIADSQGDVGTFSSLAFYSSGEPAISYYDATNGDLKYATLKAVPPVPEEWSFAIITDLHIGRGYPDYGVEGWDDAGTMGQNYYLTERLNQTINWIIENSESYNIRFVMVLGDIADSAEYSELDKAKAILSKLDNPDGDPNTNNAIPYVPVIGNHDVWPYTEDNEADYPESDFYFGKIFVRDRLDILKSHFENWESPIMTEDITWGYPGFEKTWRVFLQNYAFGYKGIKFVVLDCVARKPVPAGKGVGFDAVLWQSTLDWFTQNLRENQPTIILSHHPLVTPEGGFSPWEITTIDESIKISKADVSANFAGHVHGYYSPYETWLPPKNPHFMDANRIYAGLGVPESVAVVTTEALMVASNEPLPKGIIRIVKVNDGKITIPLEVEGEFRALNPYLKKVYEEWPRVGKISIRFEAYAFTKRFTAQSPGRYAIDFGDGTEVEWSKEVTSWFEGVYYFEHKYDGGKAYNVTLFATGWTPEGEPILEKIEQKISVPPPYALGILGFSPINIAVTDPDGLMINKDTNEIPGAIYTEEIDFNEDGELDDITVIPNRKIGDYLITVVPEPSVDPTDTYTLLVWPETEDVPFVLAENVQITNIPTQPYIVRSTETGIMPILPPTPPIQGIPEFGLPAVAMVPIMLIGLLLLRRRASRK